MLHVCLLLALRASTPIEYIEAHNPGVMMIARAASD